MEQTQCLKGINLANSEFTADSLILSFKNQTLFKIPFDKIQNSQIINKNDVTLEFPYEDAEPNDDVLCEMRFAFPTKAEGKEEKKGDEEPQQTPAEIFNSSIMGNAKIGENAGESIVTLLEMPLIIPRGKYTCDMYKNSLKLHGATYNFIVQYKHINRAFLLPKPDEVNMMFVLGLEKPMRQGSTSYPYIIMQFKKDLEDTVTPSTKEEYKGLFGGNLQEKYDGPFFEIVVKIFKTIVGINVIIPGTEKNPGWKSAKGQSAVKCSVKANEGHLYFLQKSLLFINKPVIYIKTDELLRADFHRISTMAKQARMFDLEIVLKSGVSHTFTGIEKNELQHIIDFFQQKKITVKMTEDQVAKQDMSEESDDEQLNNEREAAGKRRIKARKIKEGEIDEDDSDEEDEDFIAGDDGDDDDDDDDEDEDFEEEK